MNVMTTQHKPPTLSGKLKQRGEKPAWFERRQFTVPWGNLWKPKNPGDPWSFHCHFGSPMMTKECSGAPPRRLANRFLEVLPRGAKGSACLSIHPSIYLSAILFIHFIPTNEKYGLIPITSILIPVSPSGAREQL